MQPLPAFLASLIRTGGSRLAFAVMLMTLAAGTEGLGLVLLVPLLSVVGLDIDAGETGRLAQVVTALLRAAGLTPGLASVSAIFFTVVLVRAWLGRWQTGVSTELEYEFSASLRERLYRAIARARWSFLARQRSSDFVHVLTAEIDRVAQATMSVLYLTSTVLMFLMYAVVAFRLSWQTTGLALGCGLLLLAALWRKSRLAGDAGQELTSAAQRVYADAVEYLGAMKTVKSYSAERRTGDRFSGHSQDVLRAYRLALRSHAAVKFWFDVGAAGTLVAVVYVAREVSGISTAALLLLIFLFSRTVTRLGTVQQFYQMLLTSLPALANIARTIRECEAAAEARSVSAEKMALQTAIRFEDVSFTYQPVGPAAVTQLHLVIPAGRITAVMGRSGAGKSTVADLVMGLISPDQGWICIDDLPLTPERVAGWREQIGYVPQDGLLFHDTVRANLLWAWPGASEAELAEVLRLAAAEEFVMRLPAGLETIVGDRGVLLSTGERQRLMLARALLRRPALLVLDEATSAVDPENEQRILDAISALRGSITTLLITHRLAPLRYADAIYVLDRGRVAETFTGREWRRRVDGSGPDERPGTVAADPATSNAFARGS